MPFIRQTSFAGGEVSPTLYGRSDLAKYHVSLKRMRNFFATRQGAAMSRSGTTFCGEVKSSAQGKVRIVPFVYSDSLTFVLEFGNLYIRFWTQSQWVGNDGNLYTQASVGPPPAFEIATTYVTADLQKLKFAQQGAVLSIAHGNYQPAELTYNGPNPNNWALANIAWDRPSMQTSAGPVLVEPLPSGPPAWSSAATYGLGAYATQDGHSYRSLQASNTNHPIVASGAGTAGLVDSNWWILDDSRAGKEWQWMVTEVQLSARGIPYESAPYLITKQGIPFYAGWNSQITYKSGIHGVGTQVASNGSDGGVNGTVYRAVTNNINTRLDQAAWVIDNVAQSPTPYQLDSLPTVIPVGPDRPVSIDMRNSVANALLATNQNFVAYRIYRGYGGFFGWVGDSKTGTFTDYGAVPDYTRQPPLGTNPFKFFDVNGNVTSTEYPSCVTFFEGRRFFARTNNRPGFFWGSVINDYANFDTPQIATAQSRVQFEIASRKLEEIRFMASVGPKLLLGTQSAVWSVVGTTGPVTFSSIEVRKQIEAGANWLDPIVINGTALFVRTKGTGVRSMAYDFDRGGFFESDISLMSSHLFMSYQILDWCGTEDPWSLVLAVRNDGVMDVLTYIKDQDEAAWSWWDSPGASGLFEQVCSVPEGQEDAVYVIVNRTVSGVAHRYLERFASRIIDSTNINQAVCLDCAGIYSGAATTTITGLTWLKGQSVSVLADGNVQGPFTVDQTGAIALATAASYVVAGLPYTPQLQQLDPAIQGAEVKTVNKQVVRVGIEVDNTRGLKVGADFAHLTEWPQRQVSDAFGTVAIASQLTKQWILGNWGTDGNACIQQDAPLPLTVYGITREVVFGDA